ncbi:hypothetical protein [Holospora undulata]|nr:hypothetical protein [Holospora undulata]
MAQKKRLNLEKIEEYVKENLDMTLKKAVQEFLGVFLQSVSG